MNYRPLQDRVVIERLQQEEVSSGGIFLPASSIEKSTRGTVLFVGPGRLLDNGVRAPMSVSVGDTVLFNESYGVKTQKVNGKEYLIISEKDILAIIEES